MNAQTCPSKHDKYYPKWDCKDTMCYCTCEWCRQRKAWNRGDKTYTSRPDPYPDTGESGDTYDSDAEAERWGEPTPITFFIPERQE